MIWYIIPLLTQTLEKKNQKLETSADGAQIEHKRNAKNTERYKQFDQYKTLLQIAGHCKSFELVKNSATKTHTDFITLLMIIGYQLHEKNQLN